MKLLPHFFKYIGIVLYIGVLIGSNYYPYDLDNVLYTNGLYIQCIALISLIVVIYSKEKIEDELVKHNRLKSLQFALLVFIVVRLLSKVIAFAKVDASLLPQQQINFLLLIYIVIFYCLNYIFPWLSQTFSKSSGNEE